MSKEDFRVKEMHCFIAIDPADNSEGLIGMDTPNGWMPFVCADVARVNSLKPYAQHIAKESKSIVKLVRFSVREDIEEYEGE